MKREFGNNKDFWAGVMFIVIGGAAMLISRNYRFGSALRMGPGFFPTVLGGILIGFGICVMAVGLHNKQKIEENVAFRALILLPLSLIFFGVLMNLAGFIPAVFALVFMSAASGREFKLTEVLMLTVLLAVTSVALFIWGLGLPYPLIKGF